MAKAFLVRDERAWLRVFGACAAAECLAAFPRARTLRMAKFWCMMAVAALASRSVERLKLMRSFDMTNRTACAV